MENKLARDGSLFPKGNLLKRVIVSIRVVLFGTSSYLQLGPCKMAAFDLTLAGPIQILQSLTPFIHIGSCTFGSVSLVPFNWVHRNLTAFDILLWGKSTQYITASASK